MKKKNYNSVFVERKRIRWSSLNKTLRAFVTTLIFLAIFVTLISLFSWGVTELLSWIY